MSDKDGEQVCPTCGDNNHYRPSPIALPERTILNNRFVIGRGLGRPGGFGITYLAWDLILEITAAIKEYIPTTWANRVTGQAAVAPNSEEDRELFNDGLKEFLKEAQTLIRFSHPNIARARDFFRANNTAYLVMDYCKGISLEDFLAQAKKPLSENQALEIILPILSGLSAVHKQGFLHRDVKPLNICIGLDGTPVLLDFGAARYALYDRTSTLTVMLTAGFAPFEQYHRKGKQGPWTDIYACGATLYYLLTGTVPPDALERQHNDNLIAPIALAPQISESMNFAIVRAMAMNIVERPQNIASFQHLLTGGFESQATSINALPNAINLQNPSRPRAYTTNSAETGNISSYSTIREATPVATATANERITLGQVIIIVAIILIGIFNLDSGEGNIKNDGTNLDSPMQSGSSTAENHNPKQDNEIYQLSVKTIDTNSEHHAYTKLQKDLPEPIRSTAVANRMPATQQYSETLERQNGLPTTPANVGADPPFQALEACLGLSIQSSCIIRLPIGPIAGRCTTNPNSQLVCAPPPPPPSHARKHRPRRRYNAR